MGAAVHGAASSLLSGLFSSCGAWGPLSTALCGLLVAVVSLVMEVCSRVLGIQWLWHVGSVAAIPGLWSTGSVAAVPGLVALGHVGFSQIRDQTHDSCISRWIFYHRATSEALK